MNCWALRVSESGAHQGLQSSSARNGSHRYPVVTFTAIGHPQGERARMRFPLPVCQAHEDPDPKWYVTDQGWEKITQAMAAQNFAAPDRASIRIEFEMVQ